MNEPTSASLAGSPSRESGALLDAYARAIRESCAERRERTIAARAAVDRHCATLERDAARMRGIADALLESLGMAESLIEALADPDPCQYDHHDLCQAHSLDPRPCPHEQAREYFNRAALSPSGEPTGLVSDDR